MSYELEYKRKMFKDDSKDSSEPDFYWFIEQGSNNVRESTTGRRARSWKLIKFGWEYQIIKEVCSIAGETEGGVWTLNGRDTRPENYIKKYRKVIENAEPIENLFKMGFEIVIHPKKDISKFDKEYLEELKKDKRATAEEEFYDKGNYFYRYRVQNKQDFEDFIKKYSRLNQFGWFTVSGGIFY